jgi:YbgC/YbaW family acyl-CoA thioester hydrolase
MHKIEQIVHLSDTDTTGQVYYSKPLEWLEWCRVDWFTGKFGNFMKFVEDTGVTYFPSKATVEYKKPIFFGDKLIIEMQSKEVKKISLGVFARSEATWQSRCFVGKARLLHPSGSQ